jgi:E3 ubiquitin-protein ligase HUWE1
LNSNNDQDLQIDQAVLTPSELLDGHDKIDDRSSPRSNFNASQSEFLNLHDSLLSGGPRSILLGSSFNSTSNKDRHPKHTIQLVDYTALTSIVPV